MGSVSFITYFICGMFKLKQFAIIRLVQQGCQTQGLRTKSSLQELAKNIIYNTIGVIVEYLLSIICPRLLLSDVVFTRTDNNPKHSQ